MRVDRSPVPPSTTSIVSRSGGASVSARADAVARATRRSASRATRRRQGSVDQRMPRIRVGEVDRLGVEQVHEAQDQGQLGGQGGGVLAALLLQAEHLALAHGEAVVVDVLL